MNTTPMKMSLAAVFITCGIFFAFPVASAASTDKPNVVVMMVDNLGWGELGVYGGGKLRGAATPRLDQLANEGLLLQNFNVEPQCTPTSIGRINGLLKVDTLADSIDWAC